MDELSTQQGCWCINFCITWLHVPLWRGSGWCWGGCS